MFLYVVSAARVGYDEYDSVAVISKDENPALSMVGKDNLKSDAIFDDRYFHQCQYPLSVKFICKCDDNIEPQIVLDSFNAG